MTIYVNDQPRVVADGAVLHELLEDLAVTSRRGVAIAVGGSVVPRSAWAATALRPEDRVLVIQASQGG